MKKTSRLFLIVAAIIVAAGFVLCLIGVGVSAAAGDQLFAKTTDEGKGYTYEFDDGGMDKIKLDVTDADINIYGGAEKAYMEILNFNENLYNFQTSRAMISFKESPDASSVLRFWESGFTFKGMRYLLHPASTTGGKVINIYLTEAESVKVFEITAKSCELSAQSLSSNTDYSVAIDTGSVKLENVSTASAVSITSEGSEGISAAFKGFEAKKLSVKAAKITAAGEGMTLTGAEISSAAGAVNFEFTPAVTPFTVDVATKGKLSVNGTSVLDAYSYPEKTAADTEADTGRESETTAAEEMFPAEFNISGRDLAVTLRFPIPEDAQ